MTQKYINLQEAISELRIGAAIKRLARKHKPAVSQFLIDTCLSGGISFFTIVEAVELKERRLKTYNRYRGDVASNIKPNFIEIKKPEYLACEYEPNDRVNAGFRYYIPDGLKDLQITLEDAAGALTRSNAEIYNVYLNEFGNVFYELQTPLSRTVDELKIERSMLVNWAKGIYLYLEEKLPEHIKNTGSVEDLKQGFVTLMKSSDAIADPMLSVYVDSMLSLGRIPLMHELKDVFACLYDGKRKKEWPTLTLAPASDPDDIRQSNYYNLAKAKERVKTIYLANALTC